MANEDLSQLKIDKSAVTYRPKRHKKLIYWMAGFILIAVIITLYLTGFLTPSVDVEVTNVTQLYPSQTFTVLNASGYVVAQRKAAVASKVTGRLVSISVEEGSRVRTGEIIAQLENEDVFASKRQAEANMKVAHHNLEQAKAELTDASLYFNRIKNLLEQDFVSRSEYDAAEARYKKALALVEASEASVKAATAALEVARVSLDYTFIRAPFDAVVLTKNADIGDIVSPFSAAANAKAAVVTIADMNSLQVEVDVSESNIQNVKIGQPCEIQLDALPDSRFRGKVHMIVPTADRTKATVLVKVSFIDRDKRILPEMSAKVAFLSREVKLEEQKPFTAINKDAVITINGKSYVYLVIEDRVKKTSINIGSKYDEMTEILNGVKAGDRVVLRPLNKMRDGLRIKIKEE
ncbi:MAG: efflux RND transporter periplasmic adaptor subunit [Nitrospirae bacterium]|nr:efflux RND transporter periplasmic adaptor subunit [Nitrospirota bacterium]